MKYPEVSPPKRFGTLLLLLGFALFSGGIYLLRLGDNFYFVIVGMGVALSGIFIRSGKKLGAYCFLLTFIFMTVWSIIEIGFEFELLLSRLLVAFFLCCYIISPKIFNKLS